MKIFLHVIALLCALRCSFGEEVRLLNLDPPEAQQYIDRQDTSLKYAPKIQSNVPAVRYLGNEPHNVAEDIYLANQYHGQDGLGGYLYGYSVPDIAKTEKKKADGDLTGAYNYIAGNGQEIKVQYWDDGTGFHQVDNVPKILPKQIDDTPEVKAAKDEHQRIWNEQAERNSHPIANPFDRNFNYAQGPLSPQGQQTQAQQLVNQYQQQKQQFPNPGQNVHYQGDQYAQYQSQPSQNVNKYQQPGGQLAGVGGGSGGQLGAQGSGQLGGGQLGGGQSGGGGQYGGQLGGGQSGGGHIGGGSGQSPSGQPSGSGQYGGQSGGGQLGGGQLVGSLIGGVSGQSPSGQPSGSGQYGVQSGGGQSGGGQYGGQLGGGQSGGGHIGGGSGQSPSGQPSGSGQYGGGQASSGSQSAAGGQYGGSQLSGGQLGGSQPSSNGQFGNQPSATGQYGVSQPAGSSGQLGGQLGGGALGGQYGGGSQSGASHSAGGGSSGGGSQYSAGGQYGGGQSSGGGQYGGSASGGGYGGSGQYGGGQYSGGQQGGGQWSSGEYEGKNEGKYIEGEEEKGPPKGFFYNFDYPVGIIVQKGASVLKREGDLRDIYSANKATFEKQVQQGAGTSTGYLAG